MKLITVLTYIAIALIPMAAHAEPDTAAGGPPTVRRLTPGQYQHIIRDVFGQDIKVGGRFEPDTRQNGLLAVGTSQVSIAGSGLIQYDAMARMVADQVVDKSRRATLAICKPQRDNGPDEACARAFFDRAGLLLFRRPLTAGDLNRYVTAATKASTTLNDFYAGLSLGLAGMLASPDFLFRKETVEPDPAQKGQYRLDAYSKASRLSFFLWDTAPDAMLLAAAKSGEIHTARGLKKQVDRMLASPRLEEGVRAFFVDMLHFDRFGSFAKDPAIYPNFTPGATADSQEQTLRTIVDHLIARGGDYRDLFTTRHTFLTPLLGSVYNISIPKTTANGAPDPWVPYEYPEGDLHGIGILAHASFVALHSHPGRSSPTLRGKAVRELFLCQRVPDPPGNVDFKVVQDTTSQVYKTARERLKAHATEAMCAGCHKITDPIGLALENFDSAGGFRASENGAAIDPSGELNGKKYADALGLAKALHDDPATPACVVRRTYSFASGRAPNKSEENWLKAVTETFAENNYRFPDLLRHIAASDAFYRLPSDFAATQETHSGQIDVADSSASNAGEKQ